MIEFVAKLRHIQQIDAIHILYVPITHSLLPHSGLDIPEVDLVIQTEPPKDVDSYIHRSGRTGRAGRTGVSICFYKSQQEYKLRQVENTAGIKFKRVPVPQPADILKAAAEDAIKWVL